MWLAVTFDKQETLGRVGGIVCNLLPTIYVPLCHFVEKVYIFETNRRDLVLIGLKSSG